MAKSCSMLEALREETVSLPFSLPRGSRIPWFVTSFLCLQSQQFHISDLCAVFILSLSLTEGGKKLAQKQGGLSACKILAWSHQDHLSVSRSLILPYLLSQCCYARKHIHNFQGLGHLGGGLSFFLPQDQTYTTNYSKW